MENRSSCAEFLPNFRFGFVGPRGRMSAPDQPKRRTLPTVKLARSATVNAAPSSIPAPRLSPSTLRSVRHSISSVSQKSSRPSASSIRHISEPDASDACSSGQAGDLTRTTGDLYTTFRSSHTGPSTPVPELEGFSEDYVTPPPQAAPSFLRLESTASELVRCSHVPPLRAL